MDLNTLASQSPKVMKVMEAIKNDPNFLNELKTNPQEALNNIGVELNEEELQLVQKYEGYYEIQEDVTGIINKIRTFFGFK